MKTEEPQIVKTWWKVRHKTDDYEIGPDIDNLKTAKFWIANCSPKWCRKFVRLVKYTTTRESVD